MYKIVMNLQEYLISIPGTISLIIGYLLATALFIFVIGPFHNYIKSKVAAACGDEWVEEAGYFTMNPAKSFHWIGFVSVLITRMGFTKRVRYRRRYLDSPILGTIMIAVSGVLTYLVCCVVLLFVCSILSKVNTYGITNPATALRDTYSFDGYLFLTLYSALSYLPRICIYSALFNLIPVAPMDMGELLFIFFGQHWSDVIKKNDVLISLGLFVLAFLVFSLPNSFLVDFSNDFVNAITSASDFIVELII